MIGEHPNYTQQKRDLADLRAQRVRDEAHKEALEEQADRLRAGIAELMAGTGFELDIDTWNTGGIVLRHWTPGAPGYDFETPLEGKA